MEAKIKLALPATTESSNIEHGLDLNDLLISHPASTYFVRIESGSFDEMNIHAGDILVVDRSIDVYDKRIVVAILDGDFVVRQIHIDEDETVIATSSKENDEPLRISAEMDFTIWGVVTYTIHKCFS